MTGDNDPKSEGTKPGRRFGTPARLRDGRGRSVKTYEVTKS